MNDQGLLRHENRDKDSENWRRTWKRLKPKYSSPMRILKNSSLWLKRGQTAIFIFGEMNIFKRIGKATATSHIKDQEQYEITLLSTEASVCSVLRFY